jgi:hypothetical protein
MAITKISVRGARQHNLKNIDVEIPRNTLTVITGFERLGEVVARFRHDLCRRAAALRGDAFDLCPPVSRSDGASGCRCHRRPESGDFDRAEDHQPEPALDRRNHHRDLRLSSPVVFLDRSAALSEVRAGHQPAIGGADRAAGHVSDSGGSRDAAGSDRSRPQGRIQERKWRSWSSTASLGRASMASW